MGSIMPCPLMSSVLSLFVWVYPDGRSALTRISPRCLVTLTSLGPLTITPPALVCPTVAIVCLTIALSLDPLDILKMVLWTRLTAPVGPSAVVGTAASHLSARMVKVLAGAGRVAVPPALHLFVNSSSMMILVAEAGALPDEMSLMTLGMTLTSPHSTSPLPI